MGNSCRIHSCRHLLHLIHFILVLNTVKIIVTVEGSRTNSKLDISHAKMGGVERGNMRQVPGGLKAQIGSRPPRCEKKCILCGHCEPILVPAFPQYKSGRRHAALVSFSSRFEDSSNYKPMNWKCKCGNMIFNP
ncbi:hypothetical protein AMTRI_Chr12g270650 [Amborella trichopoda]